MHSDGRRISGGHWVRLFAALETVSRDSSLAGGLLHCSSHTRVRPSVDAASGNSILVGDIGAAHLYLIDFDPTNLPNLKSTIEERYPDVKVWLHSRAHSLYIAQHVLCR